jgi:hypothetical protein
VDRHANLWAGLSKAVEDGELGFPKDVCAELSVLARGEPVQAWATGVESHLGHWGADIKYNRPLMAMVQSKMGYSNGFETMDGNERSLPAVGRLLMQLDKQNVPFVVITEDVEPFALGPTMGELCEERSWPVVNCRDGLVALGLGKLL